MTRINSIFTIMIFFLSIASVKAQDYSNQAIRASEVAKSHHQYKEAIIELEGAHPESSYIMNEHLGDLYYKDHLYLKSEQHYKRAIEINPESIESRLGLIYPLFAQGKREEMIAVYNEILDIDADNLKAHYRLAVIYYHRNDLREAKSQIDLLLEMYPTNENVNMLSKRIYASFSDKNESQLNG